MSVEKEIVDELNTVLRRLRKSEQKIAAMDSSDKLEVVKRLINLEESIKEIRDSISVPELIITGDTTIDDIQSEKLMSDRAINVLRRSKCKTINDITKYSLIELLSMRNVGKASIDEILAFLNTYGFTLNQQTQA